MNISFMHDIQSLSFHWLSMTLSTILWSSTLSQLQSQPHAQPVNLQEVEIGYVLLSYWCQISVIHDHRLHPGYLQWPRRRIWWWRRACPWALRTWPPPAAGPTSCALAALGCACPSGSRPLKQGNGQVLCITGSVRYLNHIHCNKTRFTC